MSSLKCFTSTLVTLSLCLKNWGNGNGGGFYPGYQSSLSSVPFGRITKLATPYPLDFESISSIVNGSIASDACEPSWLTFFPPSETQSPAVVEGQLTSTLLFLLICLSALPCHITVISCIDFFLSLAECWVRIFLHFLWKGRIILADGVGRVKPRVRSAKNRRAAEKFMVSTRVAGFWILVFF